MHGSVHTFVIGLNMGCEFSFSSCPGLDVLPFPISQFPPAAVSIEILIIVADDNLTVAFTLVIR